MSPGNQTLEYAYGPSVEARTARTWNSDRLSPSRSARRGTPRGGAPPADPARRRLSGGRAPARRVVARSDTRPDDLLDLVVERHGTPAHQCEYTHVRTLCNRIFPHFSTRPR